MQNKDLKKIINWFPNHMIKAIKEIKKRLPIIDIIIEVLDARAPLSTKINLLNNFLKKK